MQMDFFFQCAGAWGLPADVTFEYVFASSEMPSFAGTGKNDAFELDFNGVPKAEFTSDGQTKSVTVDNLVCKTSCPPTKDATGNNVSTACGGNFQAAPCPGASSQYKANPTQQFFSYTGYSTNLSFFAECDPEKNTGTEQQDVTMIVKDVGDG